MYISVNVYIYMFSIANMLVHNTSNRHHKKVDSYINVYIGKCIYRFKCIYIWFLLLMSCAWHLKSVP